MINYLKINNKILILTMLALPMMKEALSTECKYNVAKKGGGYSLVKECLKIQQPDLTKGDTIKVQGYNILNNFDNLGTDEIDNDLASEPIFSGEADQSETEKGLKIDILKKEEDIAPIIDTNYSNQKNIVKKDNNVKEIVKLDPPKEEGQDDNLSLEDKEIRPREANYIEKFYDKLSSNIVASKRVSISTGYFTVNALDLKTNGVLKASGNSSRLDYDYSMRAGNWSTDVGAKLDLVSLSSNTSFKTIENRALLVGGKLSTSYILPEDKFGMALSRLQVANLGRFGRDPKKDVVMTSIAIFGISAHYEHSFEKLFDCKFEDTYLTGGENEHFKMQGGNVINVEVSRRILSDMFLKSKIGIIFEGSKFKTEGIDNKDSRVMTKISFEW